MRAEWRRSADEGLPAPERIASDVQHERAPRAARSAELGARVQGGQEARRAQKGRRSTHTGAAACDLRGWNS